MKRLLLAMAMMLAWTGPAVAQTGHEEAICTTAAVFFCENFEDRLAGILTASSDPTQMDQARYKNAGWVVGSPGAMEVVSSASGAPVNDGTKAFRWNTGGTSESPGWGFIDGNFPSASGSNPNGGGKLEYYIRWYARWDTDFPIGCQNGVTASGNCTGKFVEMSFLTCPAPCTNPPGFIQGIFLHWIQGQAGNVGSTPVRVDAVDRDDIPFTHAGWYEVNAGAQPYPLRNTWQCLEYHIKINTRAGADGSGRGGDGIIEGWTDSVQRFSYPNASETMGASGSTAPNDLLRITLSGSGNIYSPPSGITTHRYMDNVVMSTQRIGCIGAAPTPPAAPTNLRFGAVLLPLFALLWALGRKLYA